MQSTKFIEVGKEAKYQYHNITDALNASDRDANISIILHEGIYNEALDLPANICLIGVDVNKCIVQNSSGVYKEATIKCIGDFNIQNITFNMLMPEKSKWMPTYDYNNVLETFPGYTMHIIDGPTRNEKQSIGVVRNCIFYSEAFPCVGMGLRNNQTVMFSDCVFERQIKDDIYNKSDYNAAFFCHASNKKDDLNASLILNNCRFVGKGTLALLIEGRLPGGKGMTITSIDCTYQSDIGDKDKAIKWYKGRSKLNKASHGNNIKILNV